MHVLQIIIASTREARLGPVVANWFVEQAWRHEKFSIDLVDLAAVKLPLFDEPKHPRLKQYAHEHTTDALKPMRAGRQ